MSSWILSFGNSKLTYQRVPEFDLFEFHLFASRNWFDLLQHHCIDGIRWRWLQWTMLSSCISSFRGSKLNENKVTTIIFSFFTLHPIYSLDTLAILMMIISMDDMVFCTQINVDHLNPYFLGTKIVNDENGCQFGLSTMLLVI